MTPIKISQLQTLLAIENGGSLAKAAKTMNVSVPAITKAMKNLEAELDVSLLDRSAYRIRLNRFGECLAAHARSITTEIDDAKRQIGLLKNSAENHIRVSAAPALIYEFLPRAIGILRQRMPDIQVHLNAHNSFNATPTSDLANGHCDLAIAPMHPGEDLSPFAFEPLTRMHLEIIATENHPVRNLRKPELKQLNDFDWIFPSLEGPPYETIETMFHENGTRLPSRVQELAHRSMVFAMFQEGEYLAVLPSNNKLFSDVPKNFFKVDFNSQRYGWTHYLMQRKNNTARPSLMAFIEVIKELINE